MSATPAERKTQTAAHVQAQAETHAFHTSRLGMWIFLAMEMLFFAAPLFLYASELHFYRSAFALGSTHLELKLAALNTAVLLTSSLAMAISVQLIETERARLASFTLALTALLGIGFLALKIHEYMLDASRGLLPGVIYRPAFAAPKEMELFFSLYVLLTGLHAVHLTIGVLWCLIVSAGVFFGRKTPRRWLARVDVLGLYWHFVDIVWIFLFPLFYLIGEKT